MPFKSPYNEMKTTQAAAYLLKKSSKEMKYLKLLKLLYLADRKALLSSGRPISFDHYVSMDHGPVLSHTYELISNGEPEQGRSYWLTHISSPADYKVHLIRDPGNDHLSELEIKFLENIFQEYGQRDQWDLVDNVMHKLPEWEDPQGSAIPIQIRDILTHSGKTDLEAAEIEHELESISDVKRFFNQQNM